MLISKAKVAKLMRVGQFPAEILQFELRPLSLFLWVLDDKSFIPSLGFDSPEIWDLPELPWTKLV